MTIEPIPGTLMEYMVRCQDRDNPNTIPDPNWNLMFSCMLSFILFLILSSFSIPLPNSVSDHFWFLFRSLSFSYDSHQFTYVTSIHLYLVIPSHVIPIFLSVHLGITQTSFGFLFHVYLLCSSLLVFKSVPHTCNLQN